MRFPLGAAKQEYSESPPQMGSPASADWGASVFVWGCWAVLVYAALTLVANYGSNTPYSDDWYLVPELTGERPITTSSLWEPIGGSEHRFPVVKLILLSFLKLTGGNFRLGIVINVLMLGALTAALILAARRLRGRMSYSDALFPLAVLHWGDWENLLWWWQFNFIMPMTLVGGLLLIIVRNRTSLTRGTGVLAGICLVLLPLCGPSGLAFVPALAVWLGYAGILRWRSPGPLDRSTSLLLWSLVSIALLLVPLYFVGLESTVPHPPLIFSSFWPVFTTWIRLLSMSFGPAVAPLWKFFGLGMLGLLLSSAILLLAVWRKQPGERFRVLGLLSFMSGAVCLALGTAWGRAELDAGEAFKSHYVIIMIPLLYSVYFIWGVYKASTSGRLVQTCLFILICILTLPNMRIGLDAARYHADQMKAFERDMESGIPPDALSQRYCRSVCWEDPETSQEDKARFVAWMRLLHQAGIGQFRSLKDAPPSFREIPFLEKPIVASQLTTSKDGVGHALGRDAFLAFTLEKPRLVYGIRLKYSYKNAGIPQELHVSWKNGDRNDVGSVRSLSLQLKTEPKEGTVTVWVYDTIDQFYVRMFHSLHPSVVFEVSEIVLLVPSATKGTVLGPCQPSVRADVDL
jgi:hypothetical protein